jgi:choline dehydrogenase-like flavoprotein
MLELNTNQTLRALLDRIIPADDYASASEAGVVSFFERILAGDMADSAALVGEGVELLDGEARARYGDTSFADLDEASQDALITDLLAADGAASEGLVTREFLRLVIDLTAQGFYGDPGNGGNRDQVSWKMIGYRPLPDGATWPSPVRTTDTTIAWHDVRHDYDAVVIGAGAGGGVAACVLAEAGWQVLVVERGRWLDTEDLDRDHLRTQRLKLGYPAPGDPAGTNPRVSDGPAGAEVLWPTDDRWQNNAMTVGGGTRLYGAQAWRFCPEDFRMASEYGVPEGSSLANWPISADDLESDYDRAEWEIGVSGDVQGNVHAGPRRRGLPMPPLPPNGNVAALRRGADALDWRTSPVPLLINSVPYNGRGACIQCGACVGFGCPGEFKSDTRNTVLIRAVRTGRCDVLTGVQAERVTTDEAGRVTGVALVGEVDGEVVRRNVGAGQVVLGAGAIETARLLLNSRSEAEPEGLGNSRDLVGRNLQGHTYAGALAVFDDPVQDSRGPGPSIATNDHRHHNDGIIGGAMIANDFVPMPLFLYGLGSAVGLVPTWGARSKEAMRTLYTRVALIWGPVQEIPNPESRVTLDPEVRDRWGVPVARLSGRPHPEDRTTAAFISEKAVEWATSAGASTVFPMKGRPADGPSGGQHQAGTCRMGDDPANSVTDSYGRVWGHDNLHIVDGSLHVTNGGVNPVLTILALAYRVSRHMVDTYARVQASDVASTRS